MTWENVTGDVNTWAVASGDGLNYVLDNYIAQGYFDDDVNDWSSISNDTNTWVVV